MSVQTTYPGVYVQEIPSGVRTVSGVATSITAFVGRARRGPVERATTIHSYADYERTFGGLWRDSAMSFAVRDFYLNGGGQAVVVRLTREAATAQFPLGDLTLVAANAGSWANTLRVHVAHVDDDELETQFGVPENSLFTLTVEDIGPRGDRETFRNVTVAEGPRRLDRVLSSGSQLLRTTGALPAARPAQTPGPVDDDDPGGVGPSGDGGTDGLALDQDSYIGDGLEGAHRGIWSLDGTDLFNLLCLPPTTVDGDTPAPVYVAALAYCERRRAMLLVDPPTSWDAVATAGAGLDGLGLTGTRARNAAVFFPRIRQSDPTAEGRLGTFVPCGAVAGVMARTDASRGVWKAPAGVDAALAGVADLEVNLTDDENGQLNPLGINCLRSFPVVGRVVWGARTMRGADRLGDEYRYVPVRRLALNIEESLYRGTQWVVFEPNDAPLWAQIRLNVGAFMQNLFRQGAFQGSSPSDAYFVKCDAETTTPNDVNLGRVNILVGFAPLRPAEFVILQIQQIAQADA